MVHPRGPPVKAGGAVGALVFVLLTSWVAAVPLGRAPDPPEPANPDPPYVTSTVPADTAVGVRRNALFDIRFSFPMNTSNTFVFIVPAVNLTRIWIDDRRLWVTHEDFAPCTTYRLYADGENVVGESMLLGEASPGPPNPWSFTTECSAFAITLTDPRDNQTGVMLAGRTIGGDGQNIDVWFSRPVNRSTFRLTLTPSIPLVPVWSPGNTSVKMRHDNNWFLDCAMHTVTVSASDPTGNMLTNITGSKPNPWTFTTVCIAPQIVSTDPANGTTGVGWGSPIVITFSKAMNTTSVNWSLIPDPGTPLDVNWTNGNKTLTLTHDQPWSESITFTVTVAGQDVNGASLIPGPVPNPWSFTTAAMPSPPSGLRVQRSSPDLVLTWGDVPGATSYVLYSAADRFAPWPWTVLTETSGTSYVHRGADIDGLTHHYIVHAKRFSVSGSRESANSTMGVKASLFFTYNPMRTNVYWLSLPYRSSYASASDITDELGESKVDIVGKWNPATESSLVWFFFRGAWRGTDFTLHPGEGFYVGILTSFEWVVNGTDGMVSLAFTRYPPPNANVHWVSLPYTSVYARASDLVLDIEGNLGGGASTRIAGVARWDPLQQRYVTFEWTPTGWGGTDFSLVAGEGLYVRVVATFSWVPRLITPEVA